MDGVEGPLSCLGGTSFYTPPFQPCQNDLCKKGIERLTMINPSLLTTGLRSLNGNTSDSVAITWWLRFHSCRQERPLPPIDHRASPSDCLY